MKKKGFTLVELLAVIVILAIIAVIATPLILNVIENAKKGAFKSSVLGIMESAELYKVLNPNDSVENNDILFTCNGTSCKNGEKELSIKGSVPIAGTVTISKDGISVTDITDLNYIATGSKEELTIIKASDRNDTTPPIINKDNIIVKTTSSTIIIVIKEDAAIDTETGISKYIVNIYDSNNNKTSKEINNIGSIEFKGLTSGEYKIEVIATNGNNLDTKENLDNITTDKIDAPTYSVSPTGWAQSKEITIIYPSGYTNEYSLDGTTWIEYQKPVTLTENGTIRARVTDGTNYVEGSTFTVDQIDNVEPSINLDNLPDSITKGDSLYNKKIIEYIEYSINEAPSGLKEITCNYGDQLLNSLEQGSHDITCKIITNSLVEASVSKTVEITNQAYQATNLISNGSFENDLTDFKFYNSNQPVVSTNKSKFGTKSLYVGGSYTTESAIMPNNGIQLVRGHIYYYFSYVYLDSYTSGRTTIMYIDNTGQINFDSTKTGSWIKYSNRTTSWINNLDIRLGHVFASTIDWNAYFDGFTIIDLTETFGSGNEPDKEWCDRNIDYFDGTTTIYK